VVEVLQSLPGLHDQIFDPLMKRNGNFNQFILARIGGSVTNEKLQHGEIHEKNEREASVCVCVCIGVCVQVCV